MTLDILQSKRRIRSGSFLLRKDGKKLISSQQQGPMSSILTVPRLLPSDTHPGTKRYKYYNMTYYVYNPHLLPSNNKHGVHKTTTTHHPYYQHQQPLVLIHGGPGIPSDYLKPIAQHIQNRAVILYDQIGCGESSEPKDIQAYSMEDSLKDLDKLLQHLGLVYCSNELSVGFHLMGHSYGGILAYRYYTWKMSLLEKEYNHNTSSKRILTIPSLSNIQSVTLISTPVHFDLAMSESEQLLKSLQEEKNISDAEEAQKLFHSTYICRGTSLTLDPSTTTMVPKVLQQSYAKCGTVYTIDDISQDSLVVELPELTHKISPSVSLPPFMILRGEFDFISHHQGIDSWKGILLNGDYDMSTDAEEQTVVFTKTLPGCSHYPMLEDTDLFVQTVQDFLSQVESTEVSADDALHLKQ